nr:MAG TPA: hypothetical protein [Caudoviricetes sp.]DAX41583.1 MAG TPA: hypothetical protein [Caudoviricetes sp.]
MQNIKARNILNITTPPSVIILFGDNIITQKERKLK